MQPDKQPSPRQTHKHSHPPRYRYRGYALLGLSGLLAAGLGLAWTGLGGLGGLAQTRLHIPASKASQLQASQPQASQPQASQPQALPVREYGHRIHTFTEATVHVVTLPQPTHLSIAVAEDLTPLRDLAEQTHASYAINAGFFDPQNGLTTSHLTVNGQPAGNPADNERLTGNPNLTDYLPQIFNRSEFRAYQCEESPAARYAITFHNTAMPNGCGIIDAVGAGPQLLPQETSQAEAFTDYENGTLIRDAIGSVQPNARSAIGLYPDGAIALLMAERNTQSPGMTLAELADFAADLGITQLLNLDGGSSSALYVDNDGVETVYTGRVDDAGQPIERPIKSAILVHRP